MLKKEKETKSAAPKIKVSHLVHGELGSLKEEQQRLFFELYESQKKSLFKLLLCTFFGLHFLYLRRWESAALFMMFGSTAYFLAVTLGWTMVFLLPIIVYSLVCIVDLFHGPSYLRAYHQALAVKTIKDIKLMSFPL